MYEFSYDDIEDKLYFGYSSTNKIVLDNSINTLFTVDESLNKLSYFSYQFTQDKELHFNILNFAYFSPTIIIFNKNLLNQEFINKIFINSQNFKFSLKEFIESFENGFFYYSNFIISINQEYSENQFALCFNYLFNLELLPNNLNFLNDLYSKLNIDVNEPTPESLQTFKNISLNGNGSKYLDSEIVRVKGFNREFKIISSFNALVEAHKFEVVYLLEQNFKYSFFYEKLLE